MSTFGLKIVPDDISAYVTSGLNSGSIRPEQIATILTFANRAQTDYIFRTYSFSILNDFYRFNIYSEIEMDSPSNTKTSELGVVCFRRALSNNCHWSCTLSFVEISILCCIMNGV
jgi:hypothetical protein